MKPNTYNIALNIDKNNVDSLVLSPDNSVIDACSHGPTYDCFLENITGTFRSRHKKDERLTIEQDVFTFEKKNTKKLYNKIRSS